MSFVVLTDLPSSHISLFEHGNIEKKKDRQARSEKGSQIHHELQSKGPRGFLGSLFGQCCAKSSFLLRLKWTAAEDTVLAVLASRCPKPRVQFEMILGDLFRGLF